MGLVDFAGLVAVGLSNPGYLHFPWCASYLPQVLIHHYLHPRSWVVSALVVEIEIVFGVEMLEFGL